MGLLEGEVPAGDGPHVWSVKDGAAVLVGEPEFTAGALPLPPVRPRGSVAATVAR